MIFTIWLFFFTFPCQNQLHGYAHAHNLYWVQQRGVGRSREVSNFVFSFVFGRDRV